MPKIVQNKFGGVNQRVLRFEGQDFSELEGSWPEFAGIQSRINGKGLLTTTGSAVKAIFQTWTPYGYGFGYYQTDINVSTDNWKVAPFNIDPSPPVLVDINGLGNVISVLDGSFGFDTGSGLGGGTGKFGKWRMESATFNLADYLAFYTNFTGSDSQSSQAPAPTYPYTLDYLPFIDCDINPTATSFTGLNAGLSQASNTEIDNNLFPPPNNVLNDSWSAARTDTSLTIDLTSLLGNYKTILNITLITHITYNGGSPQLLEIPVWSIVQDNSIPTFEASDYLQSVEPIQTPLNFDAHGNKVDPADEYNFGTDAPAGYDAARLQTAATTITSTQFKIYYNAFVYGSS